MKFSLQRNGSNISLLFCLQKFFFCFVLFYFYNNYFLFGYRIYYIYYSSSSIFINVIICDSQYKLNDENDDYKINFLLILSIFYNFFLSFIQDFVSCLYELFYFLNVTSWFSFSMIFLFVYYYYYFYSIFSFLFFFCLLILINKN